MQFITLNNAGDSESNPILVDNTANTIQFKATLNKQGVNEVFKSCWISVGGSVFKSLTSSCTVTDYSVYLTLVGGVDIYAPTYTPVLNIIYFSTSYGVKKYGFYAAGCPQKIITLNGYNAYDSAKPLIYPIYSGS